MNSVSTAVTWYCQVRGDQISIGLSPARHSVVNWALPRSALWMESYNSVKFGMGGSRAKLEKQNAQGDNQSTRWGKPPWDTGSPKDSSGCCAEKVE